MFSKAIVKIPCEKMIHGISTANLGKPNYKKALLQHKKYIEALQSCGLEVTILEADNEFPDSTFVEDTALLTSKCAIIMNPGAESRKNEIEKMIPAIRMFYSNIEYVKSPGTAEAGDIMMVGTHFFIGISSRTNHEGANQIISILNQNKMSGSIVEFEDMLHLKTGLAYLERNNLVISSTLTKNPIFKEFKHIVVDSDESYAANCIWVNDYVLVAQDYPKIAKQIEKAGYKTILLDMSEFRKLDGGLSCLSLRL